MALTDEENVTLKDQHGNDVVLDIGNNEGTGSGSGAGSGEGDGSGEGSGSDTGVAGAYLVDTVEIGDYVDIDIDYTNQELFLTGDTTATSRDQLTGWRVLSKSGSGASGTVTLVSAGTPLKYYHPSGGVSESSLEYLADLNKEITLVSGSTQGFVINGLSSTNLASIWSSNSRINTTAGVHALTTSEVETAYAALTGVTKTIRELMSTSYALRTSNMQTAATGAGNTMSTKANDLLGIGMAYWLGGSSYSSSYLWGVLYDGIVYGSYFNTRGVRPVVSLNSGIQINSTNVGDGSSVSSAYTLN